MSYINLGSDAFVKKYQGIVLSIVAKYSTSEQDYNDLVSAGMLGLLKAKKTYKKNKGCAMSTWVYIQARYEIQKAKNSELIVKISPYTATKKKINLTSFTLEHGSTTEETPATYLMEKEDALERIRKYHELLLHLNRKFSERDRNIIIDYFINSKSIRELDKKYNINTYKIICTVRSYLQSIYEQKSSSSTSSYCV